MDATRFDRFATALGTSTSRRTAIKLLAGGALGAVLGGLGLEEAAAACTPAGKRRRRGEACCPDAVGDGRRCVCRSDDPAVTCAGRCGIVIDNCGRQIDCGTTCPGRETCGGGGVPYMCGCTPDDRATTCAGRCGTVTGNCGQTVDCGSCGGSGCFVAGTAVAMADGTAKPIELVEVGDRVLGRGGRVNRVRGVLRPVLGERELYALNDGPFFVTASHPFLTTAGWKAVDPDAAREEVPGLAVGRLTVGDALVSAAETVPAGRGGGRTGGNPAADERPIPLRALEGRRADPATPLYNLDVEGDDTYVADGLVVHNKLY
jgi:Hom_end-associated Hint